MNCAPASLELQKHFHDLLVKGSTIVLQENSAALTAVTAFEEALEFAENHDPEILHYDEMASAILH